MLTYQLRSRGFKVEDGNDLVFPNDVVVECEYEPGAPFGIRAQPSRIKVRDSGCKGTVDLMTGRLTIDCDSPLEPVDLEWTDAKRSMHFRGNRLVLRTRCNTRLELTNYLATVGHVLPCLLSHYLQVPAVIKSIGGQVGAVQFSWVLTQLTSQMVVTDQEQQNRLVMQAWETLPLFGGGARNQRLLAAMQYCHTAGRLYETGVPPWEFSGEILLNLAKALQVLFGEGRDDVRRELAGLGYDETVIERQFIPVMILRNEFDVAHAMLASISPAQRGVLHQFVDQIPYAFHELLDRVITQISVGSYALPSEPLLGLDIDRERVLDRIAAPADSGNRIL